MKECKSMSFWDVYKKKGERREDITVGLRCPYWSADCKHREKHEGKPFCMNFPLHEEIRREHVEKEERKRVPEKKEDPGKKAA